MKTGQRTPIYGFSVLLTIYVGIVICAGAQATSIAELPSPQKKISFMSDRTIIKSQAALAQVGCRPIVVSDSLPISQGDASGLGHDLTISVGAYRFVRTDVGDPDGTLTLIRGGKEICVVETSLLAGIRYVPSKDLLLLKFSSGSGRDWQIFQAGDIGKGNQCVSLGLVSNKDAVEFETKLSGLGTCR